MKNTYLELCNEWNGGNLKSHMLAERIERFLKMTSLARQIDDTNKAPILTEWQAFAIYVWAFNEGKRAERAKKRLHKLNR